MNAAAARRVQRLLRGLLGMLMLWAAVSKLTNPADFLGSLDAYQLPLPKLLLQTVAIVLPWVELLCGLLLLAGLWLGTALTLVSGMLAVFVIVTGQAWARGLEIGCGCFSLKMFGLAEMPGLERFFESVAFAFFRNLVLLALAVFLLRKTLRARSNATPEKTAG